MNDVTQTQESRQRIGQGIRRGREQAAEKYPTLQEFASAVGMTPSHLLQIEAGKRPITADVLTRIVECTGIEPNALLGYEVGVGHQTTGLFNDTIEFLGQARRLGIRQLHADRDNALADLAPFLKRMTRGEVCITGSSLRGLQLDPNNEFMNTLISISKRYKDVAISCIMTHPQYGHAREKLEGRVEGSIVSEIFQGIKWIMRELNLKPINVRLIKSSPVCFSIFLWNGVSGLGFINPYPTMKQAFISFAVTVQSVDLQTSGRTQSVFQSYFNANFKTPWSDERVTVSLEDGIHECSRDDDPAIVEQAKSLSEFLDKPDVSDGRVGSQNDRNSRRKRTSAEKP